MTDAVQRAGQQGVPAGDEERGGPRPDPLGRCDASAFAIVLDNELRSWPSIDSEQYPHGIDPTRQRRRDHRHRQRSREAKDLALVLQTGALPVNFVTHRATDVSATLGKDSLKQARDAAIGGLIVVALFLLLLYRFLGLVAVIGLGIYAALHVRRRSCSSASR